ncbi:TPA: hypothetical protein HA249_05880 [Candidatus Woesearchaeota archaeon]|nr:MAG: hypothetical protein QT07_C0004G0031 [archaeon GW2011_AR16]HIG96385.1 hypothetical protein [Candidatus Woesearchaeota archaeon]HIH47301.1 hypothetical protein [Candidatus Woesearchaeota archaeon]
MTRLPKAGYGPKKSAQQKQVEEGFLPPPLEAKSGTLVGNVVRRGRGNARGRKKAKKR